MTDNARDFESEAKLQGWKPKEEFKGDEGKWVDAQTFVERGEQFVGLMKPKMDALERKLRATEQIAQDFKNHLKVVQADKEKEIAKLEKELKTIRLKAINDGDGQAYTKAEEQLEELKETKANLKAAQTASPPPAGQPWAQVWLGENEWYGKDAVLTGIADAYSNQLRQANPFLQEKEFLDQVSEYVKKEMPQKFGNPKRKEEPEVETDDEPKERVRTRSRSGKKFEDLPQDAKRECNRLVKEGIYKDTDAGRNEYARLYFSME